MGKKDIYDNVDWLLKDLKSDIEDVLMDEVLDEVKNIELYHIQNDVLNAYTPQIYKRRGAGGINDGDNIIGTVENMELTVENITPFNDDYGSSNHGVGLADLVNDGDNLRGYFYDYPGSFNQPRPFLDDTEEEIEQTEQIDNALEKGLNKRGWK